MEIGAAEPAPGSRHVTTLDDRDLGNKPYARYDRRRRRESGHNDRRVRYLETSIPGAFVIDVDAHVDERGFFARTFCERELGDRGLHTRFPQCNVSFNTRARTLRGMHWQVAPHGEVKLVRCTAGAIWDAIVDLRPGATHLTWFGVELTAANRRQLYIPEGCAHGFITLADDSEVFYHMGAPYVAEAARGLRWDDPRIAIAWPASPAVISARDAAYPDHPGEIDG